jgi:S1-C subfamily serine protease
MTVSVDQDAPAGKAGLLIGDVLLELNSQFVDRPEAVRPLLADAVGKTIPARVLRGGALLTLEIAVTERHGRN